MKHSEDQSERLSRAVWDVLARDGLEKLTIRAVAAAAGCTTGLVMHRFPNRRALLSHARRLLHEVVGARVAALESAASSPRAALRDVLHQGLALDAQRAAESRVWLGFLAAAFTDEDLVEMHRTNNRGWRSRIERLVAAAAPRWATIRVEAVALGLLSMVEGVAALAAADPEAYPQSAQEMMLDFALDAYGLGVSIP
ncbi:TetR/AcrR family transcriptional regulator [Dactylosporangium darangshiense]|uniref:TetR/AcrR family transcriptional regulator n=1 Tax=Dactylosporangium darangshiense TaxID=579108 RepID=A0ABP8DDM8_9ACTN